MKKFLSAVLALVMILTTAGFAAPAVVSTAVSSSEEAVVETATQVVSDVAQVAAEDGMVHEIYGDLLYNVNFEKGQNTYYNGAKIVYYGDVNPKYPDSSEWTQMVASFDENSSNIKIVEANGNHYLTFQNGTSKWPQYKTNSTEDSTFAPIGYYTLFADVMVDTKKEVSGGTFGNVSFNSRYEYLLDGKWVRNDANSSQVNRGMVNYGAGLNDKEWLTITGKYAETAVNKLPTNGLYSILHTFTYTTGCTTKSVDTFAIDNVKMYYKPFNAEVTILGGNNTVAGDQVIKVPLAADTNNVRTKAELMALINDHGDKILVDLTLEDGSAFESVDVVKVDTLKAVWKDYAVSDGLSLDFNTADEVSQFTFMSKGQIDSNPVNPAEGNAQGLGYVNNNTIVDNGTYVTVKYDIDGSDGNDVDTGIYDSNFTTTKLKGGTKNNISDIGAVQIRMRVRNHKTSGGTFNFRKSDTANGNAYYSPNMRLDFFFDLDVGDGKTFTGLTGSRQACIYSGKTYDQLGGDWFTIYCDLTKLTGKQYDTATKKFIDGTSTNYWSDATLINCLRIDPSDALWTGMEIDIDFIHFIMDGDVVTHEADIYFLNDGVKTPIEGDISDIDYRYNSVLCYEFDEDIGISADDLASQLGLSASVFGAAAEYDEETYTYTFYAGKSLAGKTVTLPTGVAKIGDKVIKIVAKGNGATLSYSQKKAFSDGENLIPNGEFTVPYYNSFDIMHTDAYTMRLDSDETRLYVTYKKATENGFSTVRNNAIQFKPQTRYYVQVGYNVVGVLDENGNVDDSYVFDKTITNFWMPKDEGKYNFTSPTYYGIASDYPYFAEGALDTERWGMFSLKSQFKGQNQNRSRVFSLVDTSLSTSYISFQGDLRGAGSKAGDVILAKKNADGTTTNLVTVVDKDGSGNLIIKEDERANIKGLTYYIDHLIVKEMFKVEFVDKQGNLLETRYAAKDVPIYLPESANLADGSEAMGWTDGKTTYEMGALFTLTTAGNATFTVIPVDGTSLAPKSYNVSSIRVTDPVGLRFKSSVTTAQKAKVDEYGFVVARKSALTEAGLESNELTLDADVKKATGMAYLKEGSIDKVFDIINNDVFFTAVIYNIPESAYQEVLVARPYVKKGDVVVYGDSIERSIYGVACDIRDAGYVDLNENGKQKIDDIISVVEG